MNHHSPRNNRKNTQSTASVACTKSSATTRNRNPSGLPLHHRTNSRGNRTFILFISILSWNKGSIHTIISQHTKKPPEIGGFLLLFSVLFRSCRSFPIARLILGYPITIHPDVTSGYRLVTLRNESERIFLNSSTSSFRYPCLVTTYSLSPNLP